MKPINIFRLIPAVLIVFALSLILPSCASTKTRSKSSGLMLQDKAEYSKNKKKFKGSKAHKSQKQRVKSYGR